MDKFFKNLNKCFILFSSCAFMAFGVYFFSNLTNTDISSNSTQSYVFLASLGSLTASICLFIFGVKKLTSKKHVAISTIIMIASQLIVSSQQLISSADSQYNGYGLVYLLPISVQIAIIVLVSMSLKNDKFVFPLFVLVMMYFVFQLIIMFNFAISATFASFAIGTILMLVPLIIIFLKKEEV